MANRYDINEAGINEIGPRPKGETKPVPDPDIKDIIKAIVRGLKQMVKALEDLLHG